MKEKLLDVMKWTLILVIAGLVTLILVIAGSVYLRTDDLKLWNIAKDPQAIGVTDVEPKESEKKTVKSDSEKRLETADKLQTDWRLGRDQKPMSGIDLLRLQDEEPYTLINRDQFIEEVEKEREQEIKEILEMMDRVDAELAQGKTE